ncbi:response regulator transcription factor [Mucilaginibacter sp. X5P1]|uniref:response regulator transcription factor n=1 Tax=Mucilaginibacter sp. X5P1 TaxID=2723088 RepID=UPI0016191DFE|nr:helix-turn-helix transcriptional regulator [Mucilaginibacter sp. X5P1]MBB6139513.1 DNA-binding NarL/FixJ family response regulator [Mucilaginibacter sp. X5P1]
MPAKTVNISREIKVQQLLSRKELEFMKLCCPELTYKEIADEMIISLRTVDNYRELIFSRLQLKSRTSIALYAIHNDLFRFWRKIPQKHPLRKGYFTLLAHIAGW